MVENYVLLMHPTIIYIAYIETIIMELPPKYLLLWIQTGIDWLNKFIMSLKIYFYCVTEIFI